MVYKDAPLCDPLSGHPSLCSFLPASQGFTEDSREEVVAGDRDFRYSVPALRAVLELEGTTFPRL